MDDDKKKPMIYVSRKDALKMKETFEGLEDALNEKCKHSRNIRNNFIYFAVSLVLLTAFILLVVRPFEKDTLSDAKNEYGALLDTCKSVEKDYNQCMQSLRECYRR